MRVIADELGMTQGSLYYYFRNKQEILHFCQTSSLDSLLESAERVRRLDVSADERLRRLIAAQVLCMLDEVHGATAHIEFQGLEDDSLKDIIQKRDTYEGLVRDLIREGVKEGVFRPCDPWEIANILWTMANAVIRTESSATHRELRTRELGVYFDDAIELMLRGLSRDPG